MNKKDIERRLNAIEQKIKNYEGFNFSERLWKLEQPDKPGYCLKHGVETLYNKLTGWHCSICLVESASDKPKLKSSAEWAEIFKNKFTILDPDGWDRTNFAKSWAELITKKEFNRRVALSTIEGFYPDPAPPLRAQVAKALGWTKITQGFAKHWLTPMEDEFWRGETPNKFCNSVIPRYDKDRDLAIEALEEYSKTHSLFVKIYYHAHQECYVLKLAGETTSSCNSLPLAICEAIVTHSEGIK